MTLNWLEMRRISNARSRQDDQARILTLTRENARLAEENHRLHQQYQDLLASTDIWIRLYEAALDRANGAGIVSGYVVATVESRELISVGRQSERASRTEALEAPWKHQLVKLACALRGACDSSNTAASSSPIPNRTGRRCSRRAGLPSAGISRKLSSRPATLRRSV